MIYLGELNIIETVATAGLALQISKSEISPTRKLAANGRKQSLHGSPIHACEKLNQMLFQFIEALENFHASLVIGHLVFTSKASRQNHRNDSWKSFVSDPLIFMLT